MFVICDQTDVVRDIASEEANLSRGYNYPGYKIWIDVTVGDIRIGDHYVDGVLIKNQVERDKAIVLQQNEQKITDKSRAIAIAECIRGGELPPDFEDSQ